MKVSMRRALVGVSLLALCSWFGIACAPTVGPDGPASGFMGTQRSQESLGDGDLGVNRAALNGYYTVELLDVAPLSNRPKRNLPRDVKRAIRLSGFPLHKGSTPPSIAGWYNTLGTVQQVQNIPYLGTGMQITSQLSLWGQSGNTIQFVEHYNADPGNAYITGKNNNFTMYMKLNYYNNSCKQWALISGTQSGTSLQTTLLRVNPSSCSSGGFGWVTMDYAWSYLGTPRPNTIP